MENKNYRQNGFHSITPSLAIRNASEAITWYKRVFDAKEVMRMAEPDGKIAHAEIKIEDSILIIAEENPSYNKSPETLQGTSVVINLYVPNVDEVFKRATDAGANVIFPLRDQFYGDRSGRIQDPYGHMWIISTTIEHLTAEEMQRRFDEMMQAEQR